MEDLKNIILRTFHYTFFHQDFHEAVRRMSLADKFLFLVVHSVDRSVKWHRLPVVLGLVYLAARRILHQKHNLFNVGENAPNTSDQGSFFGRNILPVPQANKMLRPDPTLVATKLLARRAFIDTGKQFNMIAASWTQFMIHDWVDHIEDTDNPQVELTEAEVAKQCPFKSFKFYRTKQIPTNDGHSGIRTGYLNRRTPWWDGSAIYGNDKETQQKVRTFQDGKLKISGDGLLPVNDGGIVLTGDVHNTWAGVLALQALFVMEHNSICDALKKEYPQLEDEELYHYARRVTAAVIAKIHTIDWTVELLKTDTLLAAMRANWYGLLGKKFKDMFGHVGGSITGGIVGSKKPDDHGVPYSLTEEFVTAYRMHPLLPDKFLLRNIDVAPGRNKSPPLIKEIDMAEMAGTKGSENLSEIGFTRAMVSMGHQSCGALELWNYPVWLRNTVPQNTDGSDRPDRVDLPALEIYRDRERSIARYNDFRRALLLIPIQKWEDLTDDEEAVATLRQVYGDDVEELDTLVGLLGEKKIAGFAISETAFIIFILMASRRLEADRLFTSDYNARIYTKKGLDWVNTTETLKQVLDRHYPEMSLKWINSASAFSVWDAPPQSHNSGPSLLSTSHMK